MKGTTIQNKYYICTNETIINRIKIKIMKKILAIMCAAALFVACGGEKKQSVEDQAKAKIEAVIVALEAGDMEKAEQLVEVCDEWYETLSEDDQKKADKVMEQCEDRIIEAMMEYEMGELDGEMSDLDYEEEW